MINLFSPLVNCFIAGVEDLKSMKIPFFNLTKVVHPSSSFEVYVAETLTAR